MKLITDDLVHEIADGLAAEKGGHPMWYRSDTRVLLHIAVPMIVRRCVRHINAHHDDFIDTHNGKSYFEVVDEILVKVKETLRELIEETDE